jgi:hypothetical protein
MLRRILSSAEREAIERNRKEKLAELASIVSGKNRFSSKNKVAPILPMNRYKYGLSGVKAASRISPNRIVLHP